MRAFRRAAGSATLAITTNIGIDFSNFLASAGATITTLYNIKIANPVASTVTDHIAIQIDELTRGSGLNIGIRNASSLLQTGDVGFFGAAAVGQQSITGTTEQEQIDAIVAAGVALGLWTDDR
jgi:hypothetical protein